MSSMLHGAVWHTCAMRLQKLLTPATFIPLLVAALLVWSFFIRAGKGIESAWVMALVAGVCVLLAPLDSKGSRPVPLWAFWAGIAFLLWSTASWFLSSVNTYGLDELLRDGAGFLLFCTAARYADNEELLRKCFVILTSLAFLGCLIGVMVYVLQPVSRFSGVFFHILDVRDYWPNAWAEWLLLVWPVSILALQNVRRVWRTVVPGILLAGLLLSFSRGAVLVLVAQLVLGFVFMYWITAKKKTKNKTMMNAAFDALAIFVTAAVLFSAVHMLRSQIFPVESVTAKVTLTASEGTQTVSERKDFWQQSLQLSFMRPLFGFGPGTFRFVQPQLQEEVLATSDHPHNVILKLAMERGWPTALFFLIFIVLSVLPAVLAAWRKDAQGFLIALAVFGVLLHNLIDYNLQFTLIAVPLWLLLGIAVQQKGVKLSWFAKISRQFTFLTKSKKVPVYQWSAQIVLAVILLLVIVIEGRFVVLERLAQNVRAQNPTAAIDLYEKARGSLFPRDLHIEEAQLLMSQNRLSEAQTVLQDFHKRAPLDARMWLVLGDFSMKTMRMDDARSAYARAYALSTWNDLRPLHGLLLVLGRAGSQQELTELFPVASDVIMEYLEAIRHNTHFIALSWHTDEFQRVARLMAQMYPAQSEEFTRLANEIQLLSSRAKAARARERRGYLW